MTLFLIETSDASLGPCRIVFYNRYILGQNGVYHAGIFQEDYTFSKSTIGAGPRFTAALYFANDLETPLATTTFRAGIGEEFFAENQTVPLPGMKAGERAQLVVRVWETAFGSFEAAAQFFGQYGQESFTTEPLSGFSANSMYPFRGFEMYRSLSPLGGFDWGFELFQPSAGTVSFHGPFAWSWFFSHPPDLMDAIGVINPTGTTHFSDGVPEGNSAALVFLGTRVQGEAGLKRVTSSVLQPNRRYTLKAAIGNPASGTSNLGYNNFSGFPGYRVELMVGTQVLAFDENALAIPEGEFRESKLVFTSSESTTKLGESLRIRLTNLNRPGTTEDPGVAVAFDDVRLFDEPLQPTLTARHVALNTLELGWNDASDSFALERADSSQFGSWQKLEDLAATETGVHRVTVHSADNSSFFRLRLLP